MFRSAASLAQGKKDTGAIAARPTGVSDATCHTRDYPVKLNIRWQWSARARVKYGRNTYTFMHLMYAAWRRTDLPDLRLRITLAHP